jgi:hypothetical protein
MNKLATSNLESAILSIKHFGKSLIKNRRGGVINDSTVSVKLFRKRVAAQRFQLNGFGSAVVVYFQVQA